LPVIQRGGAEVEAQLGVGADRVRKVSVVQVRDDDRHETQQGKQRPRDDHDHAPIQLPSPNDLTTQRPRPAWPALPAPSSPMSTRGAAHRTEVGTYGADKTAVCQTTV